MKKNKVVNKAVQRPQYIQEKLKARKTYEEWLYDGESECSNCGALLTLEEFESHDCEEIEIDNEKKMP